MKLWASIVAFMVFSALSGCRNNSFSIVYDRDKSSNAQASGEPGAWDDGQYLAAKNLCIADFTLSEKDASENQIEAFCGCLVTLARDKYAHGEYMADPNSLRERQFKQGQGDECRAKASLPPLSAARVWQPQTLFDNDTFFKSNPTVVTLPDNQMAVTYGKVVNGKRIHYAVHYDGTKWGTPLAVGDNYDYLAEITANRKGQMIAVWAVAATQDNQNFYQSGIMSAMYDPKTGWQAPVVHRQTTEPGFIGTYAGFIDENGNAVVTWSLLTPSSANPAVYQTFSFMRLFTGGTWQEPSAIGAADYLWPTVAITPDNMIHTLVGVGNPATREVTMYAARIPLAVGRFALSDFVPLEKPEGVDVVSSRAQIQVDAKGNMAAIWDRGTQAEVLADWKTKTTVANYDITKGMWEVKQNFSSTGTGPVFFSRIAMAPNGTAFAAWVQNEGTRQLIWASRYDPAKGWATPAPIDHNAAVESSAPSLSVNSKGEALAVWSKRSLLDEKGWITMASYFNGFYWSNETSISTKTAGNITAFASVALHDNGKGYAFWTQGDGPSDDKIDVMYMAEFK